MVKNTQDYWEKAWQKENKTLNSIFEKSKRNQVVLNLLKKNIKETGVSIEAGCGYGRIVFLLGDDGYSIVGLDFSEKLIHENKEKLKIFKKQTNDVDIEFNVGDVRSLPFPDKYFANYISLGVIEHFKKSDQVRILNEAYRVLDKGGVIFISVPNKYSLWTIFLWIYSKLKPDIWIYQKNISKQEIGMLAEYVGFKKRKCFSNDVYSTFRRSFNLDSKMVKGLPNPFYYYKNAFIVFSRLCERYFPTIGYQTYYIGVK